MEGTRTWKPQRIGGFDRLVSPAARISALKALEVTMGDEGDSEGGVVGKLADAQLQIVG